MSNLMKSIKSYILRNKLLGLYNHPNLDQQPQENHYVYPPSGCFYNSLDEHPPILETPLGATRVVIYAYKFVNEVKHFDCIKTAEWFGNGFLLINGRYVVAPYKRKWRNKGKAIWYYYKTPTQFVEKFVSPVQVWSEKEKRYVKVEETND